ncbi:MAG: vWA domain-containing protein [Roseovarius sp.]|nr:vWA domain-containing protein [Roseovarius sp.]
MTNRLAFGLCATLLLALALPAPGHAQPARPLLVEGTNTVYQRVLTRPSTPLHDARDGTVTGRLPAFQPLYVYAAGDGWAQVGPSVTAGPTGWVRRGDVIDWRQNIVGAFTNPAGRRRQLLFESEERLRWLLEHEALTPIQERLLAEADAGTADPERGIVAVEPKDYVNIREELYVMPILDFVEDLHPLNYDELLLMQVASVPLEAQDEGLGGTRREETGEFDVGIVFVFDTTQSMDPYIARTRKVLQHTVAQIQGTEIGNLVNFGAIGFRDNTEAAPGLQYRTRIIAPLARRADQSAVVEAIGNAGVAMVSSPGFNEDSLAGVEDAIEKIDWQQADSGDPIDAGYVILVTDAGPKGPNDVNARSQISVNEIQTDAEGRNIVVMTLHLKTPVGDGNHRYAAEEYRALSRFAGRDYYFPIEGGSQQAFEGVASRLVTAITDHVRVARGEEALLEDEEAGEDLLLLGRAMRLAYLGRRNEAQAPDVFSGWITDKAIEAPREQAIEPRLLITKNEMATMATLIDNLVRLGEQSQGSGDAMSFFTQVRGVIADMATNPDRRINAEAATIGGALEYLDKLPYQSQLLAMSEDRWAQSAMMRRSIIDGMRQKLTQYRKWLHDDTVWTALYDGAPDGEMVFAMPFDVLP